MMDRGFRRVGRVALVGAAALTWSLLGMVGAQAADPHPGAGVASGAAQHAHPQWLVQLTYTNGGPFGTTGIIGTAQGRPWTLADFQKLAQDGVTGVEMNMDWQAMEPSPGVFDFSQVERYAEECHQAGLTFIPIFWESMWHPGNPPTWLHYTVEQDNAGRPDIWPITVYVGPGPAPSGAIPAMWSQRAFSAYQNFVVHAFQALSRVPGFGGGYVDYGWLDAVYGPDPAGSGFEGYAPPDVAKFHTWLAQRYGTVAALNQALGTAYAAFSDVPAFTPGQPHFSLYQKFRAWSYETILSALYRSIRKVSQKPIYLYFGGNMSTAGTFMNLPDTDFLLAQKYGGIINLDTAGHTGYAALFGYLSQAYHVPVLYEWTPIEPPSQDVKLLAQWMGNVPLEGRDGDGVDYFADLGHGHQFDFYPVTFPGYLAWRKPLTTALRGAQPDYPVGIMLGYDQVTNNDQGYGVTGGLGLLGSYFRSARPAADLFTDRSVLNGAVALSQFHTIIDWNGDLTAPHLNPKLEADLRAFQADGGVIIPGPLEANPNAFTVIDQPDGPYTVETVLGQPALVSEVGVSGPGAYHQYLYFKVPSTLVSPTQRDVSVQVTYAMNQSNAFFLQYDSTNTSAPVNGAYATAYPVGTDGPVTVTNTGQYQTATFQLTNADFVGGENGGADFRIAVENAGLAVSKVTVSAGGSTATFTPNELNMPAVPAAVRVSPNDESVNAFLSAGQGKVWLVVSNFGSQAFSGAIHIPESELNQILPSHAAPLTTKNLLGTFTAAGTARWDLSLPSGGLAVLEIKPG